MDNKNLSSKVKNVLDNLDLILLDSNDSEQNNLINDFKFQLLKYFPETNLFYKFTGKIEDIMIEMNEKFTHRIKVDIQNFDIKMDIYCAKNYELSFGDLRLFNDFIKLHFPNLDFKLAIFNSDAIEIDQLLVMMSFTNLNDNNEH